MTRQNEKNLSFTDAQLLHRHLDGDKSAFSQLVDRYRQELYSFLVRFTGDAALADDVFQETFLQLHISAATFDLERRLKPWLFAIAANKARDALHSRSRRQAAPLDAHLSSGQPESGTYIDLIASNIPAPDERLANQEIRQAVQNIVTEMPENLRTVLLLGYFQEMPYKDISQALNVPLGTVKSRLHAAVKHFALRWKLLAERAEHGRDNK